MSEHCKKASFSSEAVADYYIEKLKRTSVRSKKPVRAYLCPVCFTWHLTSLKKTTDIEPYTDVLKINRQQQQIEKLKKKCGNYQQEIKKLNNFIIKLKTR